MRPLVIGVSFFMYYSSKGGTERRHKTTKDPRFNVSP